MARPSSISTFGVALVLLSASSAWAQTSRPERPYRGLFASGARSSTHSLTAGAVLSGGYGDAESSDVGGLNINSGPSSARGAVTQGSGTLSYSWQTPFFSLGATAGTSAGLYKSRPGEITTASQGQLSMSTTIKKLSLSVSTAASHQPYLFDAIVPPAEPLVGDLPAPDLDLAYPSDFSLYVSFNGSAGLTHKFSERTSIRGGYDYRRAVHLGQEGRFERHGLGGRLTHNLSRGLSVYGGYMYRQARYATNREIPNHSIDAGVDFNRSLSFSRRTTLSFRTGLTATAAEGNFDFRLVGNVKLNHEIGRSWTVFAAYARDLTFHESFDEPVFSDSLVAGIGGLITRRLQFGAVIRTAFGSVGNGRRSTGSGFDNYQASAALGYAVTRYLSTGLTYSYYHHDIGNNVHLPVVAPRQYGRHSVRAMVSLWAPLLQRGGRGDASR